MRYVVLLIFAYSLLSCKSDDEFFSTAGNTGTTQPATNESPEIISIEIDETHAIDLEKDTLTYLALGDSYTIGTGVEKNERWPSQLSAELRKSIVYVENPIIVAGAGWTTYNLLKVLVLDDRNLQSQFDLVSLLIGVNNQYAGNRFKEFKSDFIRLLTYSLQKARSRAGVFVLSIPDYGVTPFGSSNQAVISTEIDMYNDYIREVCEANNIKFYDITDISRKAENDLSLLAADNLHPSGKMYADWINKILRDPLEILTQ